MVIVIGFLLYLRGRKRTTPIKIDKNIEGAINKIVKRAYTHTVNSSSQHTSLVSS